MTDAVDFGRCTVTTFRSCMLNTLAVSLVSFILLVDIRGRCPLVILALLAEDSVGDVAVLT